MISFCYLKKKKKKLNFILGVTHAGPDFAQTGS